VDPVTLLYYALVCGLLGLAAPGLRTPGLRFAIGVAVGFVAAGALPALRALLGGG
jgi:hypothetical protein